jgi:hypothetical protein
MNDEGLISYGGGSQEKRRFTLDLSLHATQRIVDDDPRRFVIARCGRKWGKSVLAQKKTIQGAGRREAITWYIGPTYKQTKRIAWHKFKRLIPPQALHSKNESDLMLRLKNAAEIYLMGADEPDSLRGPEPDFVVLEEAAMMKQEVWDEILRPNLVPKRAKAFFIGNPKGLNWYYDLCLDADQDPENWGHHHYTIYDNPHLSKDEIELARKGCRNEAIWRQEYLGEFEADAGRVFHFEDSKLFQPVPRPQKNQPVYRGIDWGMRDDTGGVWGYVSGGVLYIFQEHAQANLAASQQAQLIKSKSAGLRCEESVISHDAYRQDPEMKGLTIAWHFVRNGISPLLPSSREKGPARDLIQRLMDDEKIVIDPTKCPVLRRQLQKLEWQDTLLEKTVDGDDDVVDALHYLVYMLASKLLIEADGKKREKRDKDKLYLPDRTELSEARFSELGDPIYR